MHTVVETLSYLRAANDAGMAQDERDAVVSLIASDPEQGDRIAGTGGFRKLRVRRPGSGKSGGYRVITFFSGTDIPVFLVTVFGKGEKANLTRAEQNALARLGKSLIESYQSQDMI
jgi:hypothetical protein